MRKQLQILYIFLFLSIPYFVFSTHIVGGTLTYVYNGGSSYTVTLKLFRDCSAGTASFPGSVTISVLGDNGATFTPSRDITMTLGPVTAVPSNLPPCATPPNPMPCTQQAIYTTTVNNLPPNPGGYHLYYQIVARNLSLTNVNASGNNVGESFYAYIPGPTVNWFEDFPQANGTISDVGATAWSITAGVPAPATASVNTNLFQITGANNAQETWTSQAINISSYPAGVNLQANLFENGTLDPNDSIFVYYSLNGGPLIPFSTNGFIADDFTSAVASQANLVGNTVKIVIRVHYDAASPTSEVYQFDNVMVSGNDFIPNSNPTFNLFPPLFLCVGMPFTFDHAATDVNGDSLVYSFYTPYDGDTGPGGLDPTFPNNIATFTPITFLPGYSTNNPLGGSGLTINPSTGLLTGTPPALGQYVVGIVVKEYRNGVYISETLRDFQFNVVNCPQTLAVTIGPQNPTICFGGTSTNITANATGGTAPYTYLWNNVNPSQTISVGVGTYSVTVTDAHACQVFAFVTVTSFTSAIAAHAGPDQIKCSQTPIATLNGTITAASGGIWSGGAGVFSPNTTTLSNVTYTPTAAEVTAGSVSLFLTTTGNGTCPAKTDTIKIQYTPFTGTVTPTITNVSCFGGSNGSATINITGGTSPFSYSWNTVPAQSTATATNLTQGTYSVTIQNGIGCSLQSTVTITQPTPLAVSASVSNVACAASSITVTPTGGTSPYTYLWAPGGQTTATINNLPIGTYTVTVTDAKGCTITANYTVTQPLPLAASLTHVDVSCFGGSNGTANTAVTGGTAPFTYSWSPSGGTAPNASGLANGTYTVTVTDNQGCVATANTTIAQPTVLSASTTVTNETCDYLNNGTATASAAGGIGPYTYSWQPGSQTTATISALASGTYTVTATDAKGCTATAFATITQPLTLAASFTGQTNTACFGNSNGSATASGSGGTAAYSYSWNTTPVQSTATASGLGAGTYTVTVTDSKGCTALNSITITQPVILTQTSVITNVSCAAGANGSVAVTPAGGTSPYTYLWTPSGQTSSTAGGLAAGTYTVTVTDSKGCQSTANYTVTQPLPLAISFTHTNVSCFNGSDGTANSTVTGGTPAYTYNWSPSGGTGANATGLHAGTYTLTVTDNKLCPVTNTVVITQPIALSASTTVTNETCDYLNNGTATASATGGTGPYTYSWQPGSQTTATISALASGTYTVTATDAKGCTTTATATITQPLTLAVSFTGQTNAACFGNSNGSATASASGGTAAYSYSWNTTPVQSTATAINLPTGTYTVTATDAKGCTALNSITITQPTLLTQTSVITNVSCSAGANGAVAVTPAGGTSPYTYLWQPGGQTSSTASGLAAGTYTVTVTDSKGCQSTANYTVTQPLPLAISFTHTNVSCFNGSDGTANSTVTGGTPAYTYNWSPSGGTGANATGLHAGTYTLTVNDSKLCPVTNTVVITQPIALSASTTVTNETCDYLNNGTATASAAGGTGPYTYSWQPGSQTTATISALASGTYTVTATDAKGCTTTATATITQPLTLAVSFAGQTNVSCFGGGNGSVTASPSGGTPNYSYSWNSTPVQTAITASNLPAGTYTVTVTDNKGCTASNNVTITQPAVVLSVSTSSTPTSCNGGNNGTVSSSASGGTGPYTYNWMPGNVNNPNVSNLSTGTYTVTATDSKGCTTTNPVTVNQPAPIVPVTSSVNSTCGLANGQASVTVTGGTAPYTYLWTPTGGTGTTATGLLAGSYNVQVTDANNCKVSQFSNVTDNGGPQASIFSTTNVSCFGGSDGAASVGVIGGTGTLTYNWTPFGGNAPTATGLTAGVYTITVTDANGCQSSATTSPPISQPPAITISVSTTNVSCFAGNNATASASANGGVPGYSYLWLPSNTAGSSISGLAAGTFTMQVTDTRSCIQTQAFTITQPAAALTVSPSSTPVSCFGGSNGTASSAAAGGTSPYLYTWMPGNISAQNIVNLTAGTYTINASDGNGCTASNTTTITEPTVLVLTPLSTNSTCGSSNGQASVSVSGGTAAYAYQWSPIGGSAATATGLISGIYTVLVTDAKGCTATLGVTVNNTAGPVVHVSATSNISCFGGADGTVSTTVTGGTAPITYSWAPSGGTGATASGLSIGIYTVTASDANGCASTDISPVITQPSAISISVTTTNVSCFAGSNASASASASGGTPALTYLWFPGSVPGSTISGLVAGSYTVQVSDGNNCIQSQTLTITQPSAALSVSASSTPVSCFGGNNGAVSSAALGGTTPYIYTWTPGNISGQNISNLSAGTYTINISDNKGCTTSTTTTVAEPTVLVLTPSSVNSTCGSSNGQASVSVSGGTSAYGYQWSPVGGTSATATGLASGAYSVLVSDANNCTATVGVTVSNTAGPVVTVTSTSNVSCNNGTNGTASTTVTGGTAPITYSWAPSGGTASIATGLVAGIYTVTASDANGCISTDISSAISEPTAITVSATTTNVSCFSGNDGTASAVVGGGTPAYSYLWLPGGIPGSTINGLTANSYTLQVTDINSCVQSHAFTITEPALLTATISSSGNVSCFGGNNGTATVTAGGGTPLYSYSWLPTGGNAATATGFAAGSYTVNVSDNKGCTSTASITITEPSQALTATGSGVDASCFGGSNGTATITPIGGTPGYFYQWSPSGGTGQSASGLSAGTYFITVSDLNNCQTNVSVVISEPTVISGSLASTNASCGLNNGLITSQVSGGTPPYTYLWSPGASTNSSINTLAPGSYSVQITDAAGCPLPLSASLTNIPGPTVSLSSSTNVSCFGGNDGTAGINISVGTAPYTINWLPYGGNTVTASLLIAGTYTANVTDSLGCQASTTVAISEPQVLSVITTSVTDVLCNGGNSGSTTVSPTGGTPNYTYSWSPNTSSSATANNLSVGTYTVTVTDQKNCSSSVSIIIDEPLVLSSSAASIVNPTCFNGTGSASVVISGGTIPYSYSWNTSPVQTGSTADNIGNGSYTVTVTDANNCTVTTSALITQPTQVITHGGPDAIICLGLSGTFTATANGGAGGYYYTWQPPGIINSGSLSITPTSNESYTVTAYDQNGCAGTIDTVNAIVYSLSAANINAVADTLICPGHSSAVFVQVTGNTGPLTYTWNNNLGSGPGAYVVYPLQPTTYIITVTNPCGSTVTDSVRVKFNPPPTIILATDTNLICVPQAIQFNDNSITGNITDPINSWNWSFGDGSTSTQQNPSHTYSSPGNYSVSLSVSTLGGCTNNNASAPLIINAYPYPIAAFSVNSTNLSIPYDVLSCTNQSTGANTYNWSFGDGVSSTIMNATHLYTSVGVFQIQLIATSSHGCKDTAYAEVTTNSDVVFPNAFTPNLSGPGGGSYTINNLDNDVFFPYTSGVTDFKLQIFDRWGELIFESNDVKQGWDGYYRGKLCQQDVYVWKAYIKLNNGKTFNKAGDVTLLR